MRFNTYFTLFILLLLAYFPLFLHLNSMPLMLWDESRLAVSAYEMLQNKNFIVVTYGNNPDLWSVKPPLMIWLVAISFKFLGYNEIALRLPSALCGLFTVLVIYRFCITFFKDETVAFFSVFVLITTKGYIDYHVTRTGDYDALLILFQVCSYLFFIKYHFQSPAFKHKKHLYLSALFLSLAILTKGIAGLLLCPALLVFIILDKKSKEYFTVISTYGAILVAILPFSVYIIVREYYSGGYIAALWKMELFNRYVQGDGDNAILNFSILDKIEYYLGRMYDVDFSPWLFVLPLSVVAIFKSENKVQQKVLLLFILNFIVFMTIITFSSSKKPWYEAPIYPFLAVVVGYGISCLYNELKFFFKENKNYLSKGGLILLAIFYLGFPYLRILQKYHFSVDMVHGWEQRQYRPFMKEQSKKTGFCVLQTGYNASIEFTKNVLNEEGQFKIHAISIHDTTTFPQKINVGDKYIVCEKEAKDSVDKYFTYKTLDSSRTCGLIEVLAKRPLSISDSSKALTQ